MNMPWPEGASVLWLEEEPFVCWPPQWYPGEDAAKPTMEP